MGEKQTEKRNRIMEQISLNINGTECQVAVEPQ